MTADDELWRIVQDKTLLVDLERVANFKKGMTLEQGELDTGWYVQLVHPDRTIRIERDAEGLVLSVPTGSKRYTSDDEGVVGVFIDAMKIACRP